MKSAISKLCHSLERKYVNRLGCSAFQSLGFFVYLFCFYLGIYPNFTCLALHEGNNYHLDFTENPYTDKKIKLAKDELFPLLAAFILTFLFLIYPLILS